MTRSLGRAKQGWRGVVRGLGIAALLSGLAPPAHAGERAMSAPALAAASSFGQSWDPETLQSSQQIPVRNFRDEIYWQRVEQPDGRFRFDQFTTTYPAMLGAIGADISLILGGVHAGHDGGVTPYTPEGVAAFGRMAAAIVAKFPAIRSVEVGNEFNSQDFVTGPVRADAAPKARARRYVALLKSVYQQLDAENPDVRVIGGAIHSIPVGYLAEIFRNGAAAYMDALAIHPYTTRVEQFVRQIAVLRRIDAARTLPIEVTEFGDPNPRTAAAHLLKGYCQMALAGVTRLVWYPLNARGDGMEPLIDGDNAVTGVGRAYRFIEAEFAGRAVTDAAPDPFTYGCRFGRNKLVIWGEPRAIDLAGGVRAFAPSGTPVAGGAQHLSMAAPLILISDGPIAIGDNVRLAPQDIIADSFHQFGYPENGRDWPESDPYQRFSRRNGQEIPLTLSPGQDRPGTLWTPSLGDPGDGYLRLTAEFLRPDGTTGDPVEVVHRFRANRAMTIAIDAFFAPRGRSDDGVSVEIRLNDTTLARRITTSRFEFFRPSVALAAGDRLEFIVGPNGNAAGDVTDYRITLRHAR